MLADLMVRFEAVRRAETRTEREAIYRFRYEVYIDELQKSTPTADHDRRWLRDPEDDEDTTILFYTGTPDEITGTMRLQFGAPGTASASLRQRYSLDLFPDIDRLTISATSRLVVTRRLRGKLIFPALARAVYTCVAERGVYLIFMCCAPGLVRSYRKLGLRPYPGPLICSEDGLRVPLVMLTPDVRYYREVGSPLLPLVRNTYPQGPPAHFDLRRYARFVEEAAGVETDTGVIWDQLESDLLVERTTSLFDGVPKSGVKKLLARGYIIETPAEQTITRSQLVEQEIFVVLEGTFEELAPDGRRLAVLTKGDLLGELSLFLPGGRRATSVRSVTAGKLLVLGRKFLPELSANDPPLATLILNNLGRIMALRLARMIEVPG